MNCKICMGKDCLDHCHKSEDGKHVADPDSGVLADDVDWIFDFICTKCGQSGAVKIDPKDIQWN